MDLEQSCLQAPLLFNPPTQTSFSLSLSLHSASSEQGLRLKTPIISAGSFGLSCDNTLNLQRLLPPARKITDFFISLWFENNILKPKWETAYVYKKPSNSEDCFWWVMGRLTQCQWQMLHRTICHMALWIVFMLNNKTFFPLQVHQCAGRRQVCPNYSENLATWNTRPETDIPSTQDKQL